MNVERNLIKTPSKHHHHHQPLQQQQAHLRERSVTGHLAELYPQAAGVVQEGLPQGIRRHGGEGYHLIGVHQEKKSIKSCTS